MLFTADIGNRTIKIGLFDEKRKLLFTSRIGADGRRTPDEYASALDGILSLYGFGKNDFPAGGAAVSSVAPPIAGAFIEAVRTIYGTGCLQVGPGVKNGLNIKTDNAAELGADIAANTVAAFSAAEPPFVVVDVGFATTASLVNRFGELCGVVIMPGMRTALDSLSETAAELPEISLSDPKNMFGRDSCDSMLSGVVNGTAFALNGFIASASEDGIPVNAVFTGDLAEFVIPKITAAGVQYEKNLSLYGLYDIYMLNKRNAKRRIQ